MPRNAAGTGIAILSQFTREGSGGQPVRTDGQCVRAPGTADPCSIKSATSRLGFMRVYRVVIVVVLFIAALAAIVGGVAEWTRQQDLGTPTVRAIAFVGFTVVALSWAMIGGVLSWLRPRNRLGALMLGVGFITQLSTTEEALAQAGLFGVLDPAAPGSDRSVGMLLSLLVGFALYVTIGLLPALYPSGRLPARSWRWPAAVVVLGAALMQLQWLAANLSVPVQSASPVSELLQTTTTAVFLLGVLAVWVLCIVRLARSRYPERQQLMWLFASVVVVVITLFAGESTIGLWVQLAGLYFLPVAIGIGIVRYRLLGIETVLRRGLVYGTLTAVIVAAYAGVSALAGTQLTGAAFPAVIAAALVAVGLNPLRIRLQNAVDRLVYGQRSDPARALSDLGHRVAGAAEGELVAVLLGGVQNAVRSAGVRIHHGDGTLLGRLGDEASFHGADARASCFVAELTVGGAVVGSLEVLGRRPGERYSGQDELLLRAIVPQVAVVVRALQLTAELEREREAVAAATSQERERLRRDFHDGLGPSLTGVGLGLEALSDALESGDRATAGQITAVLRQEMQSTVTEVRRILADLGPVVLAEQGLAAAIERRVTAAASPMPIEVRIRPLPPLPPEVEEATYLVTAEAVNNVLKHANANRASVEVGVYSGRLVARVSDDGIGFQTYEGAGIGLESMRSRAAALGGECEIATAATGTTVTFTIPIGGES